MTSKPPASSAAQALVTSDPRKAAPACATSNLLNAAVAFVAAEHAYHLADFDYDASKRAARDNAQDALERAVNAFTAMGVA